MKTYIKDSTLSSESSLVRVYESVSCMNADISNIGNNEIIFAGENVFQKENDSAVSIGRNSGILQEPVIGELVMYYGTTNPDPSKYLICDGSSYSRSDWPELYSILGYTILPNLTNKTVKGIGQNSGITGCHNSLGYGCCTVSQIEGHSHSVVEVSHTHSVYSNHYHCYGYSCRCCRNICHIAGNCFCAACGVRETSTNATTVSVSGISGTGQACVTLGDPTSLSSIIRFGDVQKPKTKTVMFLIRGK